MNNNSRRKWYLRGPLVPGIFSVVLIASTGTFGCSSGNGGHSDYGAPNEYTRIMVIGPENPGSGAIIAVDRFASLLARATTLRIERVTEEIVPSLEPGSLLFALGQSEVSRRFIPDEELMSLPAEGYILRKGRIGGGTVLAGVGSDDLGTQYAAYALLAVIGFGFFHPEETYVPDSFVIPEVLNSTWMPSYTWRGMHVHTMHPVELMDSLLVPSPDHLAEVERYIDWLVANRQNYFQWVLQDTIDVNGWTPHARAIIEYAHRRGLRVGIDTPFQFVQQNAFVLVPDPGPFEEQIIQNLGKVLGAPFDVINVELGASEFIPVDDIQTMDMLNFTADYLAEEFGAQLICKVHCSSGQTAPHFGDINFNFLPGLAHDRVGVMAHTVQWYDLYRRAPTYDNEDLGFMRQFLLDEIPERTVLYYPETAYWVSFDVDIPLFLPHYIFSRWNDLNRLQGSGMDGQVTFTSGLEWGYWLNDWATAGFAYEAATDWRDYLSRFTRIFGQGADAMQEVLVALIEEQGRDLLEHNLIAYLIGWDTADDLGHLIGTHAQPVRTLFREIRSMDQGALAAFKQAVILPLTALEETYTDFVTRVKEIEPFVPARSGTWYREILRGIEVTALRVQHVRRLYQGTVDRRMAQLGLDPDGDARAAALFAEAKAFRHEAEMIIALQEMDYRWPVDRIARRRENPTSYEFGYLYTVSDAYYWRREEFQAISNNDCICLGNLVNLLDNLLGEGPVGNFVESLPPLPHPCLDQCIHPVQQIPDLW